MKTAKKVLITLGLTAIAGAIAITYMQSRTQGHGQTKMEVTPELLARGAYLADAGDCAGCHTSKGGQELGGGRAFDTPMGTIYSTNISSDKEFGIGSYSYEDFVEAVQNGVAPFGNLYPAMPYASYHKISDEDMKALYAYFMHTKPATQPNRDNEMIFPANIRLGLKFWNWFEVSDKPYQPNPEKSEAWNRGQYLVEGLGHCGECHTPRNLLMGSATDKALQGGVVDGLNAPNITAERLKAEGWDHKTLAQFLQTGASAKGTAYGEMFIVEKDSLSKLNAKDIAAITTYLLDGDETLRTMPEKLSFTDIEKNMPGYGTYMNNCAGCHGNHGEGVPNVAPALYGNATIANPDIFNTVAVIWKGIPKQSYDQNQAYYAMPAYKGSLNVKEITNLVNFLHQSMSKNTPATTEQAVSDVIKKIDK